MHSNIRVILLTAISLCPLVQASGEDFLIEPQVEQVRTCEETRRENSLQLLVRLQYRNMTTERVIVPRFAVVSSYKLFASQREIEANKPNITRVLGRYRILDASKLDKNSPDPNLFDTIPPGGTLANQTVELRIMSGRRHDPLIKAGQDYFLELIIDPWPDVRKSGVDLQKAWKAFGILWLDPILTKPTEFHVGSGAPQRCSARID